ncbi:MAG TPA: transposase, partial [Candidatus Nanoperiomorbaceae bacterium]|nr:transposase [Candidatus Nanoperiomorbaceae bacterium]
MKGYIEIEKYEVLEAQNQALRFQLEQLKRMVFGAKSERYIPDVRPEQLSLFAPPAEAPVEQEKVTIAAHERQPVKAKKHPVRLVLPEHLKREEILIEPEGLDLTRMIRIGEERTETLHYSPAELTVKVVVRPRYAMRAGKAEAEQSPILIAPLPSRFIDKCVADESLLQVILTDKYLDHLPLYRIAARFERLGMVIPRSTMSGWVAQCAERMEILFRKLVERVLSSTYLQVDETRMEVL